MNSPPYRPVRKYNGPTDYVITDKILNTSEMALVCALIDYATHIFGTEHSKFPAGRKNRIFRMPDVYQIVKDERKEKDGKIVVSFDVHNEMDFQEHIARWMPFFRVLEPARYSNYIN